MSFSLLLEMIPIALMFATPIIIAALGGLFSERSGIVNIALEGIMQIGAFAAATVNRHTGADHAGRRLDRPGGGCPRGDSVQLTACVRQHQS